MKSNYLKSKNQKSFDWKLFSLVSSLAQNLIFSEKLNLNYFLKGLNNKIGFKKYFFVFGANAVHTQD
jgi:hypothetical protein